MAKKCKKEIPTIANIYIVPFADIVTLEEYQRALKVVNKYIAQLKQNYTHLHLSDQILIKKQKWKKL